MQVCAAVAAVAASLGCHPTWIHHIWCIQVIPHEFECSGVSEQLWQKKKKGKSSMLVSYLALSRWHACYFFFRSLENWKSVDTVLLCIFCTEHRSFSQSSLPVTWTQLVQLKSGCAVTHDIHKLDIGFELCTSASGCWNSYKVHVWRFL
jgi:hypothetical protein